MSESLIAQTIAFIKEHHKNDMSGHGADHVMRVYQNICILLETAPEADSFVCKMAALLHDVDDYKISEGEPKTPQFLADLKVEEQAASRILAAIEETGFSKAGSNPNFSTAEAALLFDADKLDAIGAIGIMRVIQYGQSAKRPSFEPHIFPQENLTQEAYRNHDREDNTTINHFFDKLLRLKGAMQTQAGKLEAAKRQETMIAFLKDFFREQNAEDWLEYLDNFLKKLPS